MKVLRAMGIGIAVIFLGFLGLIVIGIVVSSFGSKTVANDASAIQPVSPPHTPAPRPTYTPRPINTPRPTATPIPVVSLHIGDLKRKYDANQVAADTQYKGRLMEVEGGTIRNITPGVISIDAVGFEKEWIDLWSLACKFDEVNDSILSVTNGAVVTVLGMNNGMSWGIVDLTHCQVTARTPVETIPTPFPTPTPNIPATITALIQPTLKPDPTPMPSPTPPPIVLSGRMGQMTPAFHLTKGMATFTTTYRGGGWSDITVYLRHSQGGDVALIAHGSGYFDGPTNLFIEEAGSYLFDIQAGDGIWTIAIQQ
jgi:hypothetical protein